MTFSQLQMLSIPFSCERAGVLQDFLQKNLGTEPYHPLVVLSPTEGLGNRSSNQASDSFGLTEQCSESSVNFPLPEASHSNTNLVDQTRLGGTKDAPGRNFLQLRDEEEMQALPS